MACYFLDSSALVKRYVQEQGSSWVVQLTHAAAGNRLFIALLTGVEVVSAITRKQRGGGLPAANATSAIQLFLVEFSSGFELVFVNQGLIQHAIVLAQRHG